jgi:serine/threonine protein kinase/tetratricopeptide (TPR) repeat protein
MPDLDEAAIFHVARRIDAPEARRLYLQQVCAGDTALQARIEALLRVHDENRGFLEPPAEGPPRPTTADAPVTEGPGTPIGPYKLLEQIGEGGFGAVFVAEQHQPVRRMVAVKILKRGMETRQVVARFEAERQALALMDHPNIARVLDGGETASGRPYFVMELVKGVPITRYCDAHQLTPRERLELFVPVCRAVQHAHQKGIIHRDLKPTNVLVAAYDGKPVPKVIDFGVAKALGQPLTDRTLFTGLGSVIGTLEYMSPEQAEFNAADIDTRADIYSLGALLYELLTGTTPLTKDRLKQVALLEVLRLIREEEPPKPSTRLSESKESLPSISAQRKLEPARLNRELRGELDWIVMKALDKDRARRYDTANGLARDIERYLQDETVEACPPSAGYRLRKFARKHRHLLGAGATFVVLLVAGAGVSIWQALRATAAEQRAVAAQTGEAEQRKQAEAVLEFVQKHILAAARPKDRPGGLGHDVSLRRAVEAALPVVDKSFTEQPLLEARLRMTLGTSFWYLGDSKTAAAQYHRAREIYSELLGPDDPATLESTGDLATAYADLGYYADALQLRGDTLARRKATLGPDHPDTIQSMRNLADSYFDVNRRDDAVRLDEETLALAKAKLGLDDERTLGIMNNLALDYSAVNRLEDALRLHQQTFELAKAKFGPDHLDTLRYMSNLAKGYADLERHEEARELREKVLPLQKAKLDPDHPDVLNTMFNLANTYGFLHRYAEALKLHQEVLKVRKAKLDPDSHHIYWSMWGVAANLYMLGRGADAVPITDEILHRAANLKIQPDLLGVANRRLEYFQKKNDPAGCRTTAELWEGLHRTDDRSLFNAACYRAVTAAVTRAADKSPEAARRADADADRAMAWLQQAVGAGYKNVAKLRQDKDLEVLRDRADFRKLLAEVEARAQGEK